MDPLTQRRKALAKANKHRLAQAELVARLRKGDTRAIKLVLLAPTPPKWMARMRLHRCLLALPSHGKQKARRLMVEADINYDARIDEVSLNKRSEIFDKVEHKVCRTNEKQNS